MTDKTLMEYAPLWLEEFRVSPQQIEQWEKGLPQGKSLIRWCLETKKVQEDSFASWARKHYSLPILTDKFSDFKSAQEISKRYGNIWPDHVAPFYEWDGILYLACLEPVPAFNAPQKFQWVLAPLSLIKLLRGESEAHTDSGQPTLSVPSGLNLEVAPPELDFGSISLEVGAQVTEAVIPPPLEAPAGLNLTPPKEAVVSAPAGLDLAGLSITDDDSPMLSPKTKIVEMPVGMPSELPLDAPSGFQLTPPTPPPIPVAPVAVAAVTPPPIPNLTSVPLPAPDIKPPVKPADAITNASLGGNHDQLANTIFAEMGQYYEKSMILLFQGESLQPWKWSVGWRVDNNRNKVVDLSSPSIFRIVTETMNSYHGNVVMNSINDSFFQTWNAGINPEHVTIVPIPVAKNLAGMIIGITSKTRGAAVNLKKIENIGIHAAEQMIKLGPLRAA
jgi:hypothetical protein